MTARQIRQELNPHDGTSLKVGDVEIKELRRGSGLKAIR